MTDPTLLRRRARFTGLPLLWLALPGGDARAEEDIPVSADVGVDWASRFVFRGVVYEDQGLIAQPWADLRLRLQKGDGALRSTAFNLGFWGSVHSEATDAIQPPERIYEVDVAPSLCLEWGAGLSSELRYTIFSSPSRAFSTAHELGLYTRSSLAWLDDRLSLKSELLIAAPTYTPYARLTYAGLQTKPGYTLARGEHGSLTAYAPLRLGLNLQGEDEVGRTDPLGYRFFQTGLGLSFDLAQGRRATSTWVQADLFHTADAFVQGLSRPDPQEEVISAGLGIWL